MRHKNNQAFFRADQLDEGALGLAESSLRHDVYRLGGWKKGADEPLGVVVGRSLKAREERVGRKVRARFAYENGS